MADLKGPAVPTLNSNGVDADECWVNFSNMSFRSFEKQEYTCIRFPHRGEQDACKSITCSLIFYAIGNQDYTSLLMAVSVFTMGFFSNAIAAPVQDDIIGADEYGSGPSATMTYSPTAPESNFGSPTPLAQAGYNIYQSSSNGFYH